MMFFGVCRDAVTLLTAAAAVAAGALGVAFADSPEAAAGIAPPLASPAAAEESAAAEASSLPAAAATVSLAQYGWKEDLASDNSSRTWVCKYSTDGGPCRYNSWGDMPSGLQCPPTTCCSKTHIWHGYASQWCTSIGPVCGPLVHWDSWSWGKCTCEKYRHLCGENAECRQEDAGLGGAYCTCKEGYVGDGTTCVEDKCRGRPCFPGECTMLNGEAVCSCPENYEADNTGKVQGCKVVDMCRRSPCGDIKAAKACMHEGPGRYSCTCNLGYVAVEVNGKLRCDDIFNHLSCSSNPCGAEGVKQCLDTARGVRCTCRSGYELVKEAAKYSCVREDPCLQGPCGTSDAVSSCVATSNSYVCTCKDGYKVATSETGQYCAVAEGGMSYVVYAGAAGGGLLLLLSVFACTYVRRGPELDEEEVTFMESAEGECTGTAYFDPSGGWA